MSEIGRINRNHVYRERLARKQNIPKQIDPADIKEETPSEKSLRIKFLKAKTEREKQKILQDKRATGEGVEEPKDDLPGKKDNSKKKNKEA